MCGFSTKNILIFVENIFNLFSEMVDKKTKLYYNCFKV